MLSLKKIVPTALAAVSVGLLPLSVQAQDWPVYAPSGLYVVGEVGVGFVARSKLRGLTLSSGIIAPRQRLGAQLSERFAIGDYLLNPDSITATGIEFEFNYFNRLRTSTSISINGGSVEARQKARAWSTTFNGIASFNIISDAVALFGKLGFGYLNITRDLTTNGAALSSGSRSESGIGIAGGLGLRFRLTHNIAIRVEGDGFYGGSNTNYFTVLTGLEFNF